MLNRLATAIAILVAAAFFAPYPSLAQTGAPPAPLGASNVKNNSPAPHVMMCAPMTAHHSFANVKHWATVFESPERARWQKPDEVVRKLDLKPGETVADIGAGTGYFTRRFANAVGPTGRAIGLDTEPAMVAYMHRDAKRLGLKNYQASVVKPNNPELKPDSVDLIFLCDAYHHIENQIAYFHRLIPALKPGGRVAIVDFHKDSPIGPPAAMRVPLSELREQMKKAGYKMTRSFDFLPYQYFAEFAPRESSRRAGK